MTKKSSLKKTGAKIFTLITLAVCLTLCLTLADLFSSLITVGGFSFSSNTTKSSAFNIYAISLSSTQTLASATNMSEICKTKNGAGYIYQNEENYYVLASAYENEADAQKVKTNLTESGTECEIITINYPELKFSITVNTEEKTALDNAVCSYKNLYRKLYDLSVSIDTNLMTEIQAKVDLGNVISYFSKIQSDFETHFDSKITTSLLELKLSLMNVDTILDNTKNSEQISIPYSSVVKMCYFKILNEQLELIKNI